MKKGFLLPDRKVPRSRDVPSTSDDANGCRSAANNTQQSCGSRRRRQPPPSIMKRGFLLGPSKLPSNNCDESLTPLPQYRLQEGGGSSTSRSKRVVTRSSALLDTSFHEIGASSSAEDNEYNQQSQPAASSSLLHFVRDESDADEGETPFHCENNDELLHHVGQTDCNPSLDSWIKPSLESFTLPSIILPSSTQHPVSSKRKPCTSKQRKPLIVEMDDDPTVREATSRNLTPLVVSSNYAVEPCQNGRAMIDNRIEEIGTRTQQQHQRPADADSGDSIRKVVPTKDSFQFTNAVSILLSKLGRSIQSNAHHKNSHPDNCRDRSVIGVGTIVNTLTETMIQSFVKKHLSSTFELLNNIWSLILDEIAQEYTEFIQSRKKKRSRSNSISPSLTLGLGMLGFLSLREEVYESLVRQLVLIETSQGGCSQDTHGRQKGQEKQLKVLALGAVYLLRCRIRCINISLTNLELDMVDSSHSDIQERIRQLWNDIEPEIGMLLSKILPSLESIVNGNASSGQTVLTSATADTCFELIEISSRSSMYHQRFLGTTSSEMTDLMKKWKSALPLIERLLATKQRWIKSSPSSDQANGNLENASSRTTCADAVLIDWFDVIKSSKRLYFDYLVSGGLLEGYDHSSTSILFVNLSGILLRKADMGESTEATYFRVGGIAQSLCQHKECIFGSITSPVYGSDSDVVSLLQDSSKLTDDILDARRTNSTSTDAFTKMNHQRAVVRAFTSWISSGNKALRILTKSNKNPEADVDLLDLSMVSLVMILRSESKQCVDLSIASLSMVWSAFPDWTPQSFETLLDALHVHSTQSFDDNGTQSTQSPNDELQLSPTCRALCTVVAKAASRKPMMLLPSILKMDGRVETMIEVVLNMLEMLPSSPSPGEAHNSVYRAASDVLLLNIASVPYLRSRLRSNPSLYTNVPCDVIIPKIVVNLVDSYAKRKLDAGASSLSGVLCNIMKASVERGRADDFMRCVLSSLQNVGEKETISPTTFLNKNGSLWRWAVCNDTCTSDCAYKDILLAAARLMIEMPSNSVPLAALASLVDNQYDGVSSTNDVAAHFEKRMFIATSGVIHFSMNELLTPCNEAEESIFSRLAPLLILRRLPRSYYRVVHKSLSSDKETRDVVGRLASILSDKWKSLVVKDSPSSLDMEHKKLLAELLGHCLPLTNKGINGSCYSAGAELHVSLYDNICKEAFSMILKSLREDRDMSQFEVDKIPNSDVSQAKIALYAVCHHIPLAVDEDDGEVLIHVASFVFEILNYQPTAISGATSTQFINEITMLQSGCTHFLAVCVDSLSYRKANGIEAATSTPLIVDIDIQEDSNDSRARNTIKGALLHIFHALVAIITTGECHTGDNHTTTQFIPSTRTAVLNSVVMMVQSSRADDTRSHWLAYNLLPPLVEWKSKGLDEDIHHPLCLAAALQVIYTVLARCGSFDWISRNSNSGSITMSETNFICRTLQCALTLFHTSGGNETSIAALRLAALKVILTVLALHQSKEFERVEDLKRYLSPAEIQKALSAMHGAANVDQNLEVRRLANQILPHIIHMQTS